MSRPVNKNELIEVANNNFKKIMDAISSLSKQDQLKDFNFDISNKNEDHYKRDKNIKDVLIHLYEWHNLLITWLNNNSNDDNIRYKFIPEPYNWKTYGIMNREFVKKHSNTKLEEAISLFNNSHKEVMEKLNNYTNEELFSKKIFSFCENNALGSYFISTTSSHYNWALKKIKSHIKSLK